MSYKTILVTEEDGVKTIMLNRPERRNAMTPEMQEELIAAFERGCSRSLPCGRAYRRWRGVLCGAGHGAPAGHATSRSRSTSPMPSAWLGCFGRCMSCRSRRSQWCRVRRLPEARAGDDLRLHAGGSRSEVWIYRGEDWLCACVGVGVSDRCRLVRSVRGTCC